MQKKRSRSTRKLETAVVPLYLDGAAEVGAADADDAGFQRLVLQYQPHGEAVHAQLLLSDEMTEAAKVEEEEYAD